MDGRRFDDLLRAATESRRSLLGGAIAALLGGLALSGSLAKGKKHKGKKGKKKKKQGGNPDPCAPRCPNGCCTSEFGECIPPEAQGGGRCGAGGALCAPCGGVSVSCTAGCETCCAGGACLDVEQMSPQQCGVGGEECFACPPGHICNAPGPGCCARVGAACESDNECCQPGLTCGLNPDRHCCVPTSGLPNAGICSQTSDCCDEKDECEGGFCFRKRGEFCNVGSVPVLCTAPLTCNLGTGRCCSGNGAICEIDRDCCEDEDLCDGGICKRKQGDVCNDSIICLDRYPYCYGSGVFGTCHRCPEDQVSTGTDELCCPSGHYCPQANEGRGACCEHEGCCVPNEDGVECGKLEFPDVEACG